jgi:RNA polymerase sigma factor (sigma-70 family)
MNHPTHRRLPLSSLSITFTSRRLEAMKPSSSSSDHSEKMGVVRGVSKRKRGTTTSKTRTHPSDETAATKITVTSSSSTSSSSSKRDTAVASLISESLTEWEMKQSMLSTLPRDKRKKLLSRHDYQLERSMLTHDLLSKEEEYQLTRLYQTAKELQRKINEILIQKQQQQQLDACDRENFVLNELGMENDYDSDYDDDDDESDIFNHLYSKSRRNKSTKEKKNAIMNTYSDYAEYEQLEVNKNDDDIFLYTRTTSVSSSKNPSIRWKSQLLEQLDQSSRTTIAAYIFSDAVTTPPTTVQGATSNDSLNNQAKKKMKKKLNNELNSNNVNANINSVYDNIMATELYADIQSAIPNWNDSDRLPLSSSSSSTMTTSYLSERDIIERLNIPGGRKEMQRILLMGAQARDTLIRSNLKLVSSISKKWAQTSSAPGIHSSGRLKSESYFSIYSGSWDRPSLSEAIQEGVIGLTTAVERFDPSRGLRFSTYATYWITNSVRQCYQRASTGCLRLPTNYYETRARFQTLVRKYYKTDGIVPSMGVLAQEMELTEERLRWILRLTQGLLSMDGPLFPSGATRAGKGGNIYGIEDNALLADIIADSTNSDRSRFGSSPMDCVELSFLRQQLERAMAVELAPFERDVIRLRLGLDDGVTRNCREVALLCGGRLKQSDIRTVERRALKKLRSPVALATYKLLTFLDFADIDVKTISLT